LSAELIKLELPAAKLRAEVSNIGAALCSLEFDSIQVIEEAPSDGRPMYYGVVVAPWPNRTASGQWVDAAGDVRQLEINEPLKQNALHGLVFDREFEVLEQTAESVSLGVEIDPTEGYPYELYLKISYSLSPDGLIGSFEVVNRSSDNAPFGIAFHPYFKFSKFKTAELKVESSAKSYYLQDRNQIPIQKQSVEGTRQDLRSGKLVAGASLDDYYTDLEFLNGIAQTKLIGPDGSGITIWQQEIFKHQVIYTTDDYPTSSGPVSAIAIEPSSCEADALNRKEDLLWLKMGEPVSGSFGVRLIP
jgi:aldose 1-epimerase